MNARWLVVLYCAGLAIWAQQPDSQLQSNSQNQLTLERAKHATKADKAVPMCPANFDDSLSTNGIAGEDDKDVQHPVQNNVAPVIQVMSAEAQRATYENRIRDAEVDVSLIVDTDGNPQDLCVKRSAGYGLDASAAQTAMKYHFEPAKKDAKPVRFRLNIQIRYRNFF